MMFFEKIFTDEEIYLAKENRIRKDKLYGKGGYKTGTDNRWCGDLGEQALDEFLRGMENENYYWLAKDDDTAEYDFKIGLLKLDVKIVWTKWYPQMNYGCNFPIDQFHEHKECNSFLFGRFVEPKNMIVLMGWITRDEFEVNMVHRCKGEVVNKMTVSSDFYEIPISKLSTLHSLSFWR